MKSSVLCLFAFVLLLSSMSFAANNTYEIQLVVSKYVFGPNENISITGYLRNLSSNSTDNVTTLVNSASVAVSLVNFTNSTVGSYTLTTDENGSFFSRSSFNPSATQILSPNATGSYTILANYTEGGGWTARSIVVVVNTHIDDIIFQLAKINFYTSETMAITVKAVQRVGDSFAAVSNVTLNITMRYPNDSIVNTYNCVTGSSGTCTINSTAPSASGTYALEANGFVGFTSFNVVPFDIEAYMKDSSALTFKNIFARGESGFVEIRVGYNSTTPSGTYNATADVIDTNGNNVLNLSSVILNSTNGFVDKISFTAVSSMRIGFYTTRVYVTKQGGDTVNTTTSFQVRDWSLTFNKASSKNSGFEYGYTTFANATVFFEAYPVERANGTVLENLTSNFTVLLKNGLSALVGSTTVMYNATCGSRACYEFNITMPNIVGDYSLSVSANYSGDYQTTDRTLKVTDITASAQATDSSGTLKELFGTTEFVYISLAAKNKTSAINASDVEVSSIIYENGTKLSYSQGNISSMNLSDSTLQWAWNSSVRRLVIDPPKRGGLYLIEIYVNNKSSVVTTRFGMNPYDVCASAKGSSDTTTSDYWYQFRTSDIIYFNLKISEAQNVAGKTLSGSNLSGFSSVYGRSSACSFDSTKKRAINNATVTVEKVVNTLSGHAELLNTTASTCSAVDNTGGYLCTVQAASGVWDGGQHAVVFNIQGDDQQTYHRASGSFDARAFYIYGYSSNWINKPISNITLNMNVYEAGSGWWNSANGLSGTAVVDSINYYGGNGEWIWPPIKYDYNVTGLNITITNGVASISLYANRTPTGRWPAGYYSAVVKATINSQVDYGEMWFSIRNWDAYATPVEVRGSTFDTKNSIGPKENISLYVRIVDAGNYNDYSGGSFLGNLTIKVKKIIDYSKSPPAELTSSNFTSNVIKINATSPWYSNANASTYDKYLLNISSTTGPWGTGYYSVIIDINGTENGYGWFNAVSFYVSTQPTNANGSGYVYNNKGNSPIYFNVTTTKSQKNFYTATDYVNTTITDAVVRLWDQTTQTQREFKYPTDINVMPLAINGSQIINVSYPGGSWPSGWYNGEINLRDSENSTSKGWIWFSVQPFRVSASTTSYNVGTRENVTINVDVFEPDYSNNARLNGNYTISSVQETSWDNGVYRITNLNYTYNGTAGIFRNATTLRILPSGGKWKPGYKNGMIIVKDNVTNDTQSTWFSFRATSFTDVATRTSNSDSGTGSNITVNITLTSPSGGSASGNLSLAYYWGSFGKTKYRFVIGNCDSLTSSSCLINSSALVTIVPPSSGWPEGYNYIYFNYVETDDSTSVIESYSNIYFYVKQTLIGYMYAVNQQNSWQNSFGQKENVTMSIYEFHNLTGGTITVNVTNVQVAKTSSSCWSDSCRPYQNVTFEIVNFTNNNFVNQGKTNMTSSGYVRINASGGTWDLGDYAVKVFIKDMSTGDAGVIKDATFRISDKNPPAVTINSPSSEQVINATTILFTATTNEQAVCYINIYDYGTFDRASCATNSTNSSSFGSACNTTKYNNATTYYVSYASKWWSYSGNLVSTDSTSHSYNHTTSGMTPQQNYTVQFNCYDVDWNYATNATTFNLLGTGTNRNSSTNTTTTNATSINITISSPANTTYSTTSIALNYTINGTASQCWYRLNNVTNVSLVSCGSTLFTAVNSTNNMTVYANNTNGTVFNSSMVFFTVNTSQANSTLVITISSPANTTYATTNTSLNFSIAGGNPDTCWYKTNDLATAFFISSCLNTTFTAGEGFNIINVYANTSTGASFNSSQRGFTVDTTGPNITFVLPTPANGSSLNASSVYINVTLNELPNFIRFEFNGTNYTMTSSGTNLSWFRNQTNLTIGNYTYKVYANDSVGNMNVTLPRTLIVNGTG